MILRFFALAAVSLGLLAPVSWADEVIRIMAANTSSGNLQSYDPGHGNRIFQGLDPDIALVQEMNVTLNGSKNSAATYRQWVNENFGTSFHYHVETGKSIPNGIVSRYPFLATGVWEDTQMPDREYVWARIDIPGDMNLLAISVHLSSGGGSSTRNTQAGNLRTLIQANKLATDHVVLGGDFNTDSRSEACLSTLSPVVVTSSPWPVDQAGLGGTNASRAKPYDWVAPGASLAALSTPLVIGSNSFANGLVFDSRVYTPLTAVAPVMAGDSGATGMQHMAVMRAFLIPTNDPPLIAQGDSVSVTLSKNNTPMAFSRSLSATDPENNTLTWSILTQAANGTAGIAAPASGGSVNLSYQPALNYTGSDSFVVRVSDGQGGTDTITVNLTIQEPPNTAPVILEGSSVAVTLSKNNAPTAFSRSLSATDANGDALSWAILTQASHGTAGITTPASGGSVNLSYQPALNYTGSDAFTVTVSDGRGGSDSILVNLTIEAVSALDTWTHAAFQPLDPEEEATVWGEAADPDQDGYTNLEEFAHGLDPKVADAAPNLLAFASLETDHAILTFKMRMDGASPALDYAISSAGDPSAAWSPAVYTLLSDTDLGNGFTERRIRLDTSPSLSRLFYRLVYTRATTP
ncbi:Ig-like domain-containing protein [Luteolibacter sp. GHJ8]|uniref:Ig-like domain-containing protein n=1 Tax=Luteolibacter rhizosphaerae TaxID=2989719 RepID=A0ABT3GA99_9BACT|nr:Ig-like domain-containing protein [Luteolibacter rhizosphaerae]MCW1916145.1 Ig-like domain-containing protein [Luteolibacter rhizosphaerae]